MKKITVKIISIIAVISLLFTMSMSYVTASALNVNDVAQTIGTKVEKSFYNLSQKVIDALVNMIGGAIPEPVTWVNEKDYVSENFMSGMDTFVDSVQQGAKWNLGYASASILTGNELDGKHFVAGGIAVKPKYAKEVLDDSRARAIAINDGTGRGTAVFVVLDAYGLANNDVRVIRERVSEYAKANNIVSVNVSVLHQHSAVDTFGMNGNILKDVFVNPFRTVINKVFHKNLLPENGKNREFMENLYNVTADTIKEACKDMKAGKLYYSEKDVTDYIVDKRLPYALDTNMERLRFVPSDGSKETWFTTSVIHCVGNGVQGLSVTADYPYYMEKEIQENADVNFMLMLGAELGTSQNHSAVKEEDTRMGSVKNFGKALGDEILSIDKSTEKEIEPILNIKHSEVDFQIDNTIIKIAAKAGLFENTCVKADDGRYVVKSEIGYMEMGKDFAIALVPGELEASVAYGNALDASNSWSGKDWEYKTLNEIAGSDKKLLVFGLTNDQIGYIVPDNDFMPMLVPDSKSVEFVSLGSKTASHYVEAFTDLVNSVK